MIEHEDFVFRPVLRGLISADRLLGPDAVSLGFIALLNEAIDVEQENSYRAAKAAEEERTRRI